MLYSWLLTLLIALPREIYIKHSSYQESIGCKWQKPNSDELKHEREYIGSYGKYRSSTDFKNRRIQKLSDVQNLLIYCKSIFPFESLTLNGLEPNEYSWTSFYDELMEFDEVPSQGHLLTSGDKEIGASLSKKSSLGWSFPKWSLVNSRKRCGSWVNQNSKCLMEDPTLNLEGVCIYSTSAISRASRPTSDTRREILIKCSM